MHRLSTFIGVKRIERSSNFRGDEDWLTDSSDLKIAGEAPGAYKKFTWDQVKTVSVKPEAATTNNISCTYTSEYNPWVYECTVKAPTTLTPRLACRYAPIQEGPQPMSRRELPACQSSFTLISLSSAPITCSFELM